MKSSLRCSALIRRGIWSLHLLARCGDTETGRYLLRLQRSCPWLAGEIAGSIDFASSRDENLIP